MRSFFLVIMSLNLLGCGTAKKTATDDCKTGDPTCENSTGTGGTGGGAKWTPNGYSTDPLTGALGGQAFTPTFAVICDDYDHDKATERFKIYLADVASPLLVYSSGDRKDYLFTVCAPSSPKQTVEITLPKGAGDHVFAGDDTFASGSEDQVHTVIFGGGPPMNANTNRAAVKLEDYAEDALQIMASVQFDMATDGYKMNGKVVLPRGDALQKMFDANLQRGCIDGKEAAFTEGRDYIETTFTGTDCSGAAKYQARIGYSERSYVGMIGTDTHALNILNNQDVFVKVLDANSLPALNTAPGLCNKTDWKFGEEKDVANTCPELGIGDLYTIVKLTDDQIFFGDVSGAKDGSTAEKRPTDLQTMPFVKKAK